MNYEKVVIILVNSISEILARIIVLFTAITVHEYSHGYVAYKLGDPTAKYSGRLSLNPMKHLDVWGALCMVLFGFGWAKPVPINPMYFRDRKRDTALVSFAGPLSNIVLAFVSTIIAALYFVFIYIPHPNFLTDFIYQLFIQLAIINIGFAVFNLIPIPPLDGSKILAMFLSNENHAKLMRIEQFGFPILIVLSLTGVLGNLLRIFINPLYSAWVNLFEWIVNILV